MTTTDIQEKLCAILTRELALADDPELDATLADLGADSLDYIDLILAIEDGFDIDLNEADFEANVKPKETTVAKIAEYLGKKLNS
jgi:acyl carrier protein